MPQFSFICNECRTRKTEFVRSHSELEVPACPDHGPMSRNFHSDLISVRADRYRTPIHSDALAIAPSQRKEHEKLFPDIVLDDKCRPVFDNFEKHEAYLNATGFQKNPGKQKRRAKKIS